MSDSNVKSVERNPRWHHILFVGLLAAIALLIWAWTSNDWASKQLNRLWWEDVFGVMLTGFSVSLVLPLLLGAVVAIVFGQPKAFGIVKLFLHPNPWRQLWIGVGLGALVWQVFLAGYLFEPLATNFTQDRPPFCEFQSAEELRTQFSEHNNQYRYEPVTIDSILFYTFHVVIGGTAVIAIGLMIGWMGWYLSQRHRLPEFQKRSDNQGITVRWKFYPILFLGTVLGYLLLMFITYGLFHGEINKTELKELSHAFGESMVETAGWGKSEARSDYVKLYTKPSNNGLATTIPQVEFADYYHNNFANNYGKRLADYFPVFGAFIICSILIIANYLFYLIFRPKLFSPASGITFLLHFLLFSHVIISYFVAAPDLIRLFLFLLILGAGVVYKLRFPGLSYHKNDLVSLQEHYKPAQPLLPENRLDLIESKAIPYGVNENTKLPEKKPMAIICLSGGGSRAGAWSMKMLSELDASFAKENIAFPYHVRLITGASGGMFAGAYYVSTLNQPDLQAPGKVQRAVSLCDMNSDVRQDFLSPICRMLIRNDLPSLFLPLIAQQDRGTALEDLWQSVFRGHLHTSFADLHAGEKAGWRPSIIFSPMLVEDGRQLLISNLNLKHTLINRANELRGQHDLYQDDILSKEGIEFFKLFPQMHAQFKLATAVRMSASFPYLFPAAELPTNPPRRVVDAGYYDNFGVGIAAEWIYSNQDWIRDNCSKLVIIQIRDGIDEPNRRRELVNDALPSALMRGMSFLTSPVEGLYNFRNSSTSFRNDSMLDMLTRLYQANNFGEDFLTTCTLEFSGSQQVAMNLILNQEECQRIDDAAKEELIQGRIAKLIQWWKS
ncbi:MAG: patatin-like phospholipase family protein [Zavarzinella sp.]